MENNNICSICHEILLETSDNTYTLSCNHTFHVNCIIESLRFSTECPYCRDNPFNKDVQSFNNDSDNDNNNNNDNDNYNDNIFDLYFYDNNDNNDNILPKLKLNNMFETINFSAINKNYNYFSKYIDEKFKENPKLNETKKIYDEFAKKLAKTNINKKKINAKLTKKMNNVCKEILEDYKKNNDEYKEILEIKKNFNKSKKKYNNEIIKTLKNDCIEIDKQLKWDIYKKLFSKQFSKYAKKIYISIPIDF